MQLQFIIFSGRVSCRSFLASPHTQPSFSLLWLLTLTTYIWSKSFSQTHRRIGACDFASQLIHLKGDVNNNNSCPPISNWIYVPRSFLTTWCLEKKKVKKELGRILWLLHKSKCIKDRPFAEGSRGCHALIDLYAQSLNVKERHAILPPMIATFIMQSVTFIALQSQVRTTLIFPYNKRSYLI